MTRQSSNIVVLGSTGSIGTQTLDIIKEYPDRFKVAGLVARKNWELLAKQAREAMPLRVAIADTSCHERLREALRDLPISVEAGDKAVASIAAMPEADTTVTAMVGYSGLVPTIKAIESGKRIALSNKETLVVAGELITDLASRHGVEIVPVDSEHSAIFQCLVGEDRSRMHNILLTASGGPFRTYSSEQMANVTAADALRHPNWNMGAKVTIDSASMMNKGFEMIEARWLFDCPPEKIKILVHPQSVVHSMVEFCDGSVKAQLGVPDMHLPIRYALGYPTRLESKSEPLSFARYNTLTFEEPDMERFPMLRIAFDAIAKGGNAPCVMNAANEVAVDAFLHERLRFVDMPRLVTKTMERTPYIYKPTLQDFVDTHAEATAIACELISTFA